MLLVMLLPYLTLHVLYRTFTTVHLQVALHAAVFEADDHSAMPAAIQVLRETAASRAPPPQQSKAGGAPQPPALSRPPELELLETVMRYVYGKATGGGEECEALPDYETALQVRFQWGYFCAAFTLMADVAADMLPALAKRRCRCVNSRRTFQPRAADCWRCRTANTGYMLLRLSCYSFFKTYC